MSASVGSVVDWPLAAAAHGWGSSQSQSSLGTREEEVYGKSLDERGARAGALGGDEVAEGRLAATQEMQRGRVRASCMRKIRPQAHQSY